MNRVEESRRRLRRRLEEIGRAADRDVERALAVKDAALAILGAVGMLVAARRVGKAVRRKRRKARGEAPPSSPSRRRS